MYTRLAAILAAIVVSATVLADSRERQWPYFRSAGVVVQPERPLPEGLSLTNASLEMRLANNNARVLVVGRDGQSLVRVDLQQPAGTHVVIVWGKNLRYYQPWVFIDGRQMPWDQRSRAAAREEDPAVWKKSPPAMIRIEGRIDELRAYPYAMTEPELANAYARAAGREMKALEPIDARFDYRMSIGRLRVLLNVRANYGKAAGAKVVLQAPDRTFEAVTEEYDAGAGAASFPVGELPAGKYLVSVTVFDAEGRSLDQGEFEFERIDLPWLHNRLGCGDEVSPPFTPVNVKGRKVACIERTYTVADTGLPESVVVRGQKILASPVAFELATGGHAVDVQSDRAVVFGRTTDSRTSWAAAVSGGGVRIASDAVFEFDGMARYVVTVAPTAGPVTVDRLALAVPLKAQYGEKIHTLPIGGGFRDYEVTRQLPSQAGIVWESKTGFPRGDIKPTVGSFVPMVWLGGVERGLCYFADSDEGWVPSDAHSAVSVTRRQGTITLRLNFVSQPFVLNKPRKITFALLATPTKPLPEDYRVWGRGKIEKYPLVAGRIYSCDSFAPWKTQPREEAFDIFPKDYDFQFAARCACEQRGSGGKYAPGQPLLMYQDKAWGRTGRDGLYFDWEWKAAGVRRSPLIWSSPSLVDCRVWYWNQYLRHGVYDGIYLDDAFPTHHYNWETGSAYKLPDGRIQPGTSFFGLREYLKRLWNLFHAHGKRPIVTVHTTATLMLPALTFATSVYDGEDTTRMGVHDFLDVWPMERFQIANDPQRTGLITLFMFKGSYADKYAPDPQSQSRLYRSVWTGWLLHDLWYSGSHANITDRQGKRHRVLGILSEYDEPDTVFHAYYKSGELLTVHSLLRSPLSRDQLPKTWFRSYWSDEYLDELAASPLQASAYQRHDRMLVVVGNYAYVPVRGQVQLDLPALGVSREKLGAVRAADVDDWPIKEASIDAIEYGQGTIRCMVPPHSFRLVELRW